MDPWVATVAEAPNIITVAVVSTTVGGACGWNGGGYCRPGGCYQGYGYGAGYAGGYGCAGGWYGTGIPNGLGWVLCGLGLGGLLGVAAAPVVIAPQPVYAAPVPVGYVPVAAPSAVSIIPQAGPAY